MTITNTYIRDYFIKLFLLIFLTVNITSVFADIPTKSPQPEKIKIQLKYFHQFQFAGYYAALHKGFYREEGLDVELIEGGTLNPITNVLHGKAHYGVASNDILLERINNKPIVLLAAIFQTSPSVFLSLKSANINSAHDLINKKIMLLDEYRDPELLAIFYQEGIPMESIYRVSTTYDVNDLINGKTDILNAYSTNEPYFLKEKGIPYTILHPQSYGIDFYGDGLFTTEEEVDKNPERVEALLRATKKGWTYALENQEEIIDIILDVYKVKKSREHLRFEAQEIQKLILNEYVEIGHINLGRLENIAKICAEMGMIKTNYDLTGFVYQSQEFRTPSWLKWLLIIATLISSIVIIISFYLFIFNKQLRSAVARQTADLSIKNKELQKEIQERTKTEIALKRSERRLREMIENLPSGAILVENDDLFTNKKVHLITGYTNKETPNLDTWFARLYKERKKENLQIYIESKNKGFNSPTITKIYCKDGIEKDVEFHAYSFGQKEIWLMNDITARIETEEALKESEKRLRTYIEESPNGVVIFNQNGNVTYSNPAFSKLIKVSQESIHNYNIPDFFSPRDIAKNQEMFTTLMKEGKAQGEVLISPAKGEDIHVYISAVEIRKLEYIGFIVDISTLKQVEKDLLTALEKAEESDRLKSAFLANMSHEIRTPMNGILGFSQLLLKENLAKEKKEKYVDILNQNGKQLLDIINNIIDISYLEVHQLKVVRNVFSISKLMHDLEFLFKLEKKHYHKEHLPIEFVNLVPDKFDSISSDYGKIKQVLVNLINNALKFTNQGYIRVTASFANSKLSFSVEDTGIGIPQAKQNIIFERFGQVENIYTKQFGGAGLGLPISKGIIELLKGEIRVTSDTDQGATFSFDIPVTSSIGKKVKTQISKGDYNWDNKKIMVVEDVDINISYFKELFETTKANLIICKNGKEAIHMCQSGIKPNLILMDIQMPEINGLQATREIRKIWQDTPIIAQTAYTTASDRQMAIEAGCTDFFTKPLNSEKLLNRIDELLLSS
jgi:PAS domain S-box-containing protein